MKNQPEEKIFTKKGLVIGALLFSCYGAILLLLDPEWVTWAGLMTMGALALPDLPPPLFSNPEEGFQMASFFSFLSLLAILLLVVVTGEARLGWLSWLKTALRERLSQEAPEAKERLEVGVGAPSLDVDLSQEK